MGAGGGGGTELGNSATRGGAPLRTEVEHVVLEPPVEDRKFEGFGGRGGATEGNITGSGADDRAGAATQLSDAKLNKRKQ